MNDNKPSEKETQAIDRTIVKWKEAGDKIEGTVVAKDVLQKSKYDNPPRVWILDNDGRLFSTIFGKASDRILAGVQIGDTLRATYFGKTTTDKGYQRHCFIFQFMIGKPEGKAKEELSEDINEAIPF